ncbi:hypothetical protein MKX03_004979 [Papaver bracteatum]|nr:hypothetical protein MKX03_004979 [Papaver bracteatum]
MMSSLMFPNGSLDLLHDHLHLHHHHHDHDHEITVDIIDTPKEYIFHFDVPVLFKTDIQVNVIEKENVDSNRDAGQIIVVENDGNVIGGGEKEARRRREIRCS